MNGASYAYAIARPFELARVAGLRGVDGAPIQLVRHLDLVAVISPFEPAAAEEAALRARLERLPELSALAHAHHAVVEAVAARSTVLPLRLATIYQSERGVAELLRRAYRDLTAGLDRLVGKVELGVKLHLAPGAMTPTAEAAASGSAGTATSGRDYLRQRRQQRERSEHSWRVVAAAADQLDRALSELAVDRCAHRLHSAQQSAAGENILNVAYLVQATRIDAFIEQARRLCADVPRASVEVTGPWAPYSFAVLDDALTGPIAEAHGDGT